MREYHHVQQFEQIQTGITQIKQFLLTNTQASNDQKQIDLINLKMDYLINAAKRQGRIDWLHTCVGVIVTLSTSLALAPEQTKAIWAILKEALIGIVLLLPK